MNTSTLENRIISNITLIKNNISIAQIKADENLRFNTSILDWRIFNNVSALNQSQVATTTILQLLKINISSMNHTIVDGLSNIHQNISFIDNTISILANNVSSISTNISALDNRIIDNISILQNNAYANSAAIQQYIQQNATVLDWRIFYNISKLNISLQNNISEIKESILKQTQIIEYQNNKISNLIEQINCLSNQSYSMINGSCIQVTCVIQGQKNINGTCQCTILNSVVQAGQCICPINSNVIDTSCECYISLSEVLRDFSKSYINFNFIVIVLQSQKLAKSGFWDSVATSLNEEIVKVCNIQLFNAIIIKRPNLLTNTL
ncbi:Hypothetical_protein [Hexamita inflata]|uniref:Hypothetical_protein n=1 Tax=Hexamita inflata TaxID=28002 RepID=A0AA86QIM6_9EUKA|nr:Hypothetical protein HINF_LOCUS42908 [Hexamita inflata]